MKMATKNIQIGELTPAQIEQAQRGEIRVDLWKTSRGEDGIEYSYLIAADVIGFEQETKTYEYGSKRKGFTYVDEITTWAITRVGRKEFQSAIRPNGSGKSDLASKWYMITMPDQEIVEVAARKAVAK